MNGETSEIVSAKEIGAIWRGFWWVIVVEREELEEEEGGAPAARASAAVQRGPFGGSDGVGEAI
jgi:hypothetical protein